MQFWLKISLCGSQKQWQTWLTWVDYDSGQLNPIYLRRWLHIPRGAQSSGVFFATKKKWCNQRTHLPKSSNGILFSEVRL